MRGNRNQGMYRRVQVGRKMTAADRLRFGDELYQQLDSGDEILVNWVDDHYEVEVVGDCLRKFNKVVEIEEFFRIKL